MKVTPDTNVLLRLLTNDDPEQRRVAEAEPGRADAVVVSIDVLCEVVWTLLWLYKFARADVPADIRRLINASNVAVDRGAAEAGLSMLDAGGEFAVGMIAYESRTFGSECLISFDRQSAALLTADGQVVKLLS